MAIRYSEDDGGILVFEGRCAPDEADPLLEWLRRTRQPRADLAACTELHTALAQLLVAARVHLEALPSDACLAACLVALDLSAAPKSDVIP